MPVPYGTRFSSGFCPLSKCSASTCTRRSRLPSRNCPRLRRDTPVFRFILADEEAAVLDGDSEDDVCGERVFAGEPTELANCQRNLLVLLHSGGGDSLS